MVTTSDRVLMGRWGTETSYDALSKMPDPKKRGSRHNPMRFDRSIDLVYQSVTGWNFEIEDPHYYLNNSGTAMIMTMTLAKDGLAFNKDGDYITAMMKTSTNSTWATEFYAGSGTRVCSNGLIWADHQFKGKNTLNAEGALRLKLIDLVERLPQIVGVLNEQWEHYDNYDLSSRQQSNDILVQAAESDVISYRDIPHVKEHWETPEHPEFKGRNLGNMVQAFTSHQRTKSPFETPSFSRKLITFMDDYSDRRKERSHEPLQTVHPDA